MTALGSVTRAGLLAALFLVFGASLVRPVLADDGATVSARVHDAMAKTKSYAVSVSGSTYTIGTKSAGPIGITGEIVVVQPDFSRIVMSVGGVDAVETIRHAGTIYLRRNGGAWYARKASRVDADPAADALGHLPAVTLLADRFEDGVSVGVFSFDSKPNAAGSTFLASTTVCSYDKSTYLLKRCTMTMPDVGMRMTSTYSKWNDPSNVVELPSTVASPAPAASSPAAAASSSAAPSALPETSRAQPAAPSATPVPSSPAR